jgi:class 3 adenylate cyclase
MPAASIRASVVFLKMEEFAHRPVTEQARLRAQLEAVVAVTTAELDPAGRIVLDAQDGVAIVVLRDPDSALRLAELALSAGAAGLPLAVGINFGSVQLAGDGMVGDGIAVAASVAEFASASRLLVSRSFRDAIADWAPGLEAALVPAGTFTDSGLRTHELFRPNWNALARRARRYRALSVAAVIVFLGAGIGARIAEEGRQKFVDGVVAKYRDTAAQGERYVRGLVEKVKF